MTASTTPSMGARIRRGGSAGVGGAYRGRQGNRYRLLTVGATQARSLCRLLARFNPPPALVWGNTMNPNYLDFEQPIAELEMKIEELQGVGDGADLNLGDEIDRLGRSRPC